MNCRWKQFPRLTRPFYLQDTFSDPDNKGNKEYLLACAFSHVHMQKNGELNLFGVASSSPFFRSFMEKYGIKVHVFKHGKFKSEWYSIKRRMKLCP